MSYNGAGVFSINTAGQPVVTGTVITSTAFNAFTADIATGLSTCLLKDGTQTATAKVPFAVGIDVTTEITTSSTTLTAFAGATTLLTIGGTGATATVTTPGTLDATNTTTGSVKHAGGLAVAKALWVGGLANIAGNVTLGGSLTLSTGLITVSGAAQNNIMGTATGAGTYICEVRNSNATASSATTALTVALTGGSNMTNANFIAFYDADGQASLTGSITSASATTVAYNTSSDGRRKKNVRDFTGALDIMDKVQPRQFEWIKGGATDYGFVWQEMKPVYPYPCTGDENEGFLGMDYGKVTPLLAAALKELKERVVALEAT